jgi:hypothetical protein
MDIFSLGLIIEQRASIRQVPTLQTRKRASDRGRETVLVRRKRSASASAHATDQAEGHGESAGATKPTNIPRERDPRPPAPSACLLTPVSRRRASSHTCTRPTAIAYLICSVDVGLALQQQPRRLYVSLSSNLKESRVPVLRRKAVDD